MISRAGREKKDAEKYTGHFSRWLELPVGMNWMMRKIASSMGYTVSMGKQGNGNGTERQNKNANG
jgi:hypothetical protein